LQKQLYFAYNNAKFNRKGNKSHDLYSGFGAKRAKGGSISQEGYHNNRGVSCQEKCTKSRQKVYQRGTAVSPQSMPEEIVTYPT